MLTIINSVGVDGSFGNEDSSNSILSFVGRKITPAFNPMGISNENWPATVGLITGIFAKETVVGTINALYSQLDETKIQVEKFNFAAGIKDAFWAIPIGFKEMIDTIFDPMGLKTDTSDKQKIADDMQLSNTTFAEMEKRFHNKNNAFAYLLFVLIYMPCVAVVAAIYREAGGRWAVFSVLYLTVLAWLVATIYYQISIFRMQPAISLIWLIICSLVIIGFYIILRFRSKNRKSL